MDVLDIVRYFGALFLVLGLLGGAAIAVKRFGLPGLPGAGGRRMRIVESMMLGPRHRLFLVRLDGKEHLVAAGPQGIVRIDGPLDAPAADAVPGHVS